MTPTRSRLGSALLALTTLVSLAACSKDAETTPGEPTSSASASPSTSASADPSSTPTGVALDPNPDGTIDYCDEQEKYPFKGEAADKFGAENVAAAYCEMVTLQMSQSFLVNLLRAKAEDLTPADFQFIETYMTQSAREDWAKAVEQGTKEGHTGEDTLNVSTFYYYGMNSDGYILNPNDPAVVNQSFSPAVTEVDTKSGEPRLGMKITIKGDIILQDTKTKDLMRFKTSKDVSLYLVPNPSDPEIPWLIDAWYIEFENGGVTPYTPTGS